MSLNKPFTPITSLSIPPLPQKTATPKASEHRPTNKCYQLSESHTSASSNINTAEGKAFLNYSSLSISRHDFAWRERVLYAEHSC